MIEPGAGSGSGAISGKDFELDFSTRELRRFGEFAQTRAHSEGKSCCSWWRARGDVVNTGAESSRKIWGKSVFLDTDNSINGAIRKIRKVP